MILGKLWHDVSLLIFTLLFTVDKYKILQTFISSLQSVPPMKNALYFINSTYQTIINIYSTYKISCIRLVFSYDHHCMLSLVKNCYISIVFCIALIAGWLMCKWSITVIKFIWFIYTFHLLPNPIKWTL